jgi:hypothetical protein
MKKAFLVVCVASLLAPVSMAVDPPREAEVIVKEYHAVKQPAFESAKQGDQAYIRTYIEARTKALEKQNELALELYRGHPKDERAAGLMLARWRNLRGDEKSLQEMEEYLKEHPESPIKKEILYTRAMSVLNSARPDMAQGQQFTEEFITAFPKDEQGANLLSMIAMRSFGDKKAQLAIYRRIAADYAGTMRAKLAEGSIRRVDAVGKPPWVSRLT